MQLFAPKAFLPTGLTTKFVQLFAQDVGQAANKTEEVGDPAQKLGGADAGKGSGAPEEAAAVGNATEKAAGGDEAGETEGADAAAKAAGRSGGGAVDKPEVVRARSGVVGYSTNKDSGEATISMPRFIQDEKGNWVYHYWGATYGKIWRDTRFGINRARTVQRLRVDSLAIRSYYPT